MTKGRKPLPTAIKRLRGTFKINPNRENLNEPRPPARGPTAPSWLDEYAVQAWDHFADILQEMGLFSVADECALIQLVTAYSRWRQASEKVDQYGMVTVRDGSHGAKVIERNRYDLIARDWFDRFLKLLTEFGLTPSSRSRITVGQPSNVFEIVQRDRA